MKEVNYKLFDLNVEKVLGDWEVSHAIREIIANAIDETILTKSRDIQINKDKNGNWYIRDFGRGLAYRHLTQKENAEKVKHPNLIGKFGVGLKDALAVFNRHGVSVLIKSKHGDMTLVNAEKAGFEDVKTLHVKISQPTDSTLKGTEFILSNVTDQDIKNAKEFFLRFSANEELEGTKYGSVIQKDDKVGKIYINGVKVNEEPNFLFSYNITSLTTQIKKALNRERTNVGRTAYSERIKSILTSCNREEVAKILIEDLRKYETGEMHDELQWIDVQERAIQILNSKGKFVFLTPNEIASQKMMVDEAINGGYELIPIPENLRGHLPNLVDINGNKIKDLTEFIKEYAGSFEFKFINVNKLSAKEKEIFSYTDKIFALIGGKPKTVKDIKISENMRSETSSLMPAVGVWQAPFIIIKRTRLNSLESYSETLLHEVAHALSGADDVSRQFELKLSELLGKVASNVIK